MLGDSRETLDCRAGADFGVVAAKGLADDRGVNLRAGAEDLVLSVEGFAVFVEA